MSTHISIEARTGYLRATFSGEFPSAGFRELGLTIRDAALAAGETRILLDGSALAAPQSEMDRFNVGAAIAEVFADRFFIAVLFPAPLINKFTENVAVNRGANVLVVADEDAALRWLFAQQA